jgi:hypothetical protein
LKNLPVADKDWQNPKARKRAEEKARKEEQEKAKAAAAEKTKQEEAGQAARQAEEKAREKGKERKGEDGVMKALEALEKLDKAWGKRAADGWKEPLTQADLAEAWGLLKRVQPDIKKIVAWTQNGHKAEVGDHLARDSLKQEEGQGRLVGNFGPDGVPGCKHPEVGGQEEDEADESDEDESDSESGSGSESSGGGSESETPGGGDEQTNSKDPSREEGDGRGNKRGDSKNPAKEERSGLETKEKGKGAKSATESSKRRGAINGADKPLAQKPKLNTRAGKGGIRSPDGGATPPIQAGGHGQILQEASTKGGKKGKVGNGKPGGEGSGRAGGKNKCSRSTK